MSKVKSQNAKNLIFGAENNLSFSASKIIGVLLIIFSFLAFPAYAFIGNFGGRVGAVIPCVNGIAFHLIPPLRAPQMSGLYMYYWGTLLKQWWQPPRPGLKVIGKAVPGGICVLSFPTAPIPTMYTIIYMGTSMW